MGKILHQLNFSQNSLRIDGILEGSRNFLDRNFLPALSVHSRDDHAICTMSNGSNQRVSAMNLREQVKCWTEKYGGSTWILTSNCCPDALNVWYDIFERLFSSEFAEPYPYVIRLLFTTSIPALTIDNCPAIRLRRMQSAICTSSILRCFDNSSLSDVLSAPFNVQSAGRKSLAHLRPLGRFGTLCVMRCVALLIPATIHPQLSRWPTGQVRPISSSRSCSGPLVHSHTYWVFPVFPTSTRKKLRKNGRFPFPNPPDMNLLMLLALVVVGELYCRPDACRHGQQVQHPEHVRDCPRRSR